MGKDNAWLKPVMIFYGKTTSWIVFPLVFGLLLGKYVGQSNQFLFLVFFFVGFGITCFGIYREIKKYKKDLEKDTQQNGNK